MYCTPADVSARVSLSWLVQLAPDGAGGVDTARVQSAINDADGQIDLFARAVYETPFDPVPEGIRDLSVVLTIQKLFAGTNVEVSSALTDSFRQAALTLKGLLDGSVKPEGAVIKAFDGGATSSGYVQTGDRQFTRDGRGGF